MTRTKDFHATQRRRSIAGLLSSASAGALVAGAMASAAAQTATGAGVDPAGNTAAKNGAKNNVEEVVVTAQKRRQSINKVPLSITAVSGAKLTQAGVTDTRDLAKIAPGFTFQETQIGNPVYTLRGVGFYDQSLSSTPAVSVYNDEVPLTFPAETRGAVLDLNQVEVLKGPQGTLFGQNATGGAIDYIPNRPTPDWRYGLDLGYGRFNQFDTGGFVSGPLSDTVRTRLAFQNTESTEGWQKSYTDNKTLGRINKTLFRSLTDWAPNDQLSVSLNINGWFDKSDSQAAQLVGLLPQNPATVPSGYLHYPFAPHNDQAASWDDFTGGSPARDEHFLQANLRVNYRLNEGLTLTSISSFDYLRGHSSYDSDGTDHQSYDYINNTAVNTEYQELRLTGTQKAFNWIVGSNYEHDATNQDSPFLVGYSSISNPAPGIVIDQAGVRQKTDSDTYAFFGNAEYRILDNLRLQGGLRYNHDTHEGTGCGYIGPDNGFGALFDGLSSELSGGLSSPHLQAFDCFTLGPAPYYLPALVNQSLNEHNLSWRTSLSWNAMKDILLYTTISKGYKGGGLPAISATVVTSLQTYPQESVQSYEAGVKATLFDRRVQFNGAGFYYDYTNKQVLGNYLDSIFGIQPRIVSIPQSRVWGIEEQIITQPFEGLSVSAAATYLNSKIQQYVGYDTLGQFGSFANTILPYTPTWTAAADAQYQCPVSERWDAFFGGGLTFNSRSNSGIGDLPVLTIAPYALVDLRAGLKTDDGKWTLTAYGQNVTNQYYWSTALHIQDGIVRYAGRPASYGLRLSLRF